VDVQVVVVVRLDDAELLLALFVHAEHQLVEDVEVALERILGDHPGLLQEEVGYLATHRLAAGEQDLDVLALTEKDMEHYNENLVCNHRMVPLHGSDGASISNPSMEP